MSISDARIKRSDASDIGFDIWGLASDIGFDIWGLGADLVSAIGTSVGSETTENIGIVVKLLES